MRRPDLKGCKTKVELEMKTDDVRWKHGGKMQSRISGQVFWLVKGVDLTLMAPFLQRADLSPKRLIQIII